MKFSIIIQYYNRRNLLINTLNSIRHSILKNNCEIIITDDASDSVHAIDDISSIYSDLNIKLFKFTKVEKWWSCAVVPANKGIAEAKGDIIILQGAEIYHNGDILLDISKRIKPNDYLVYGCFALSENYTKELEIHIKSSNSYILSSPEGSWYQHSIHRNKRFNFCISMYRNELLEMGGFDERYGYGVNYGDADFIMRVEKKAMNIISIDDPYTLHQFHKTMQVLPPESKTNKHGKELYEYILNNEKGYKVKNSFLK